MRPRLGALKVRRVLPPPDGRMSVISRLAQRHLVDDRAGKFVVDVDDDGLVRLLAAAGAVAEQHARAADAELEALAAQGLDQHAELELAAAGDLEAVAVGGLGDADRDIALGLALAAGRG